MHQLRNFCNKSVIIFRPYRVRCSQLSIPSATHRRNIKSPIATMAETGGAESSANFIKKHWEGWRGFYADRFAFLENYTRFIHRDKPLPSWSQSDVDEFIASDPIHGPTLKTTREAVQVSVAGSAIGAVTTGAFAWKYSKSPHGALLALGAGAVFGWTFSHEIANHWFQLYRLDTMAAQTKFMEWWEKKTEGC